MMSNKSDKFTFLIGKRIGADKATICDFLEIRACLSADKVTVETPKDPLFWIYWMEC